MGLLGSLLKKIPVVGTVVNLGSAAMSGIQAATARTPEERNRHLADMALSGLSAIPGVGTAISTARDVMGAAGMDPAQMIGGAITSLTGGSKKDEGGGGGDEGGGGGGGGGDEGGGGGGGGDEGGGDEGGGGGGGGGFFSGW
jgi:hypothetical protein